MECRTLKIEGLLRLLQLLPKSYKKGSISLLIMSNKRSRKNERSRKYVFTWNNYTDETLDMLSRITCRYLIYGKEVAPTTNTPHLQGFLVFQEGKTFSSVQRLLVGAHVESARGSSDQCIAYCKKDGEFVERGERPRSSADCGDAERARWVEALGSARTGNFEEIPPDIFIRYYGSICRIRDENIASPESNPRTCGYWLVGSSGSGKSRGCREKFPDLYPKPLNKWWCGYTEQSTVLLDDVDRSHGQWIGSFLKIWADHYPFIAEKKGRSVPIRPRRVLVTSQYWIADIFGSDTALVEALERRFRVIEVASGIPIEWEEENVNLV